MIRLPQRPIRSFATSVCAVNKASKRAPIPKAPKKTNRLPPSELAAAAERAEKLRESVLKQAVAERELLATKAQRKAVIDREASSARVAAQRAEADRLEEVVTEPVVYEPAAVVEEAPGPGAEYGKSETIYTGQPSFSVPLVLTAALVFAVFAMNGADMARVGYADWDEEKQEYELAPTWKRYLFAAGFGGIGIGVTIWSVLIPARIVTKMSIRRPTSARPTQLFPQHSLVTIHTPLSKLPFLRAREVPISNISLLGPLSTSRRSYHPRNQQVPLKPPGPIRRLLAPIAEALIPPASTKSKRSHWDKLKQDGTPLPSHVPILLKGDRASYSLAVRRGPSGRAGDEKGAWCLDWDALERRLLGVEEAATPAA